jgi:hypothetical protein
MLSLRALQLLLRHFDSIDKALSKRLSRKNPWPEEALTAVLCDLLDSDTQPDEPLDYPLSQLLADFASTDEPLGFRVHIETHTYPTSLERYVTQADLGLVVSYQDQFEPQNSHSSAWLLQAKRAFPSRSLSDSLYNLSSAFSSRDAAQEERMAQLRDWAGSDFIRYLLYCPRLSALGRPVREALNHHRAAALAGNIFDYALGLLLREDLLSSSPTVAAGMFVAFIHDCPRNLGEVHRSLFGHSTPFAWFLLEHFGERGRLSRNPEHDLPRKHHPARPSTDKIERLVRGDHRVLEDCDDLPDFLGGDIPPRILPTHTLDIQVICGNDRPQNPPSLMPI